MKIKLERYYRDLSFNGSALKNFLYLIYDGCDVHISGYCPHRWQLKAILILESACFNDRTAIKDVLVAMYDLPWFPIG